MARATSAARARHVRARRPGQRHAYATAWKSTRRWAEDELVERALQSEKVRAHLNGKRVRKTIVVPRKLVDLVIG